MKKSTLLIFILILLISYPAIREFLPAGLFDAHDLSFHIKRLYFMNTELRAGQFPVRWVSDLNTAFGYPTFNYYYPGSYYLAQPFLFFGLNAVQAYKIIIITTFVLSGFFMFLLAKKYWGQWGGLISAVIYLYAPYRFISLYVNGTFGVSVAFCFLPLIFYFLYLFSVKKTSRYLALASFFLGLTAIIHNSSILMFLPLLVFYSFYLLRLQKKQKKTFLLSLFSIGILSLYLSAFFILPALGELSFVRLSDPLIAAEYSLNFPTLRQILYSAWGYGYSVPGTGDGMSFQVGVTQWLIAAFLSLFIFLNIRKKYKDKYLITLLVANFWLIIFIMLQQSNFLWQLIIPLQRIQFPWKLLEVAVFIIAFAAGGLTRFLNKKTIRLGVFLGLGLLAFYANRNHLRPYTSDRIEVGDFIKDALTADTSGELTPVWSKSTPFTVAGQEMKIVQGKGELWELQKRTSIVYRAQIDQKAEVIVGRIYFPGHSVYLNGKKINFQVYDQTGIMSFFVPPGNHLIEVKLEDTPIRAVGNYLSLAGLLVLVYIFWKNEKII